MGKKRNRTRNRFRLQGVTLCISTAMVLVLLGLVVFSVLIGRNLSSYVKENLVVTMWLDQDMSDTEAQQFCKKLRTRPFINNLQYVSKEQALKDGIKDLGADPTEFADGNPFLSSIELTLNANYANSDSLRWISKELKNHPKVNEIAYQKDLVDAVNKNIAKISIVLLFLAVLLTIVSFSLINNTVRLGIYARRFSIHTMKLVGASWGFIRKPFLKQALWVGIVAAIIAILVLGGLIYALYYYEPQILTVLDWKVAVITASVVLLFGIIITTLCANISVNKFLKMTAGDLYKI
ncbi:MAG: permease-like cell division protein FtsX [Prevotella sp.]|nr:permease-like cell division protein FtsX [Prevotella sp.]MBQ1645558.1 permease-like cell division protein FtsX [Prevotella sp.]MBQ1666362.1 permease-like cell division protein FtsX [Prevotella sp.]MBQ1700577.1 permease-like cell division protein FtsX [Prevotella sp.]MBQ1800131.1 permease-like cell division protein FtsX [Prevotella sp.]